MTFRGSSIFFHTLTYVAWTLEKKVRQSKHWSSSYIRWNMPREAKFWKRCDQRMVLELRKCQQINRNHSVSQTPGGVRSSYSGVSKYSPVLQDCKVWAPSDHWWWRYTNFYFCRVSHCVANNGVILLNTMGVEVFKFSKKYNDVYLHDQWSDEAHTLQSCSTG